MRWLVLVFFLSQALAQNDLLLRVLLDQKPVASVVLGVHKRTTPATPGPEAFGAGLLELAASGNEVLLGGKSQGNWVELAGEGFSLNGQAYRGNLWVVAKAGQLMLINRVWLEEYLLGVVPSEVPAYFPDAVLEAQAILARTFALYRLNPKGLYDLCATERCQVYRGRAVETIRHSSAVEATRSLIISYANQAITAVYHADSGGYTAASSEVWGSAVPYLVSRPDPYSQSPKGTWNKTLSPQAIAKALSAQGFAVGSVKSLEIAGNTESGRPLQLRVRGSSKVVMLSATQSTRLLRALGLPSTLVRFEGFQVYGQGRGHGVGLSQWGARGLALSQSWDFRQILGYYYPGTFLGSFEVVSGLQQKLYQAGFLPYLVQK
jgi:stage II sporulation protein D